MKNKNILITLFYVDGIHGGVKYSAELGEHFNSLGYNVYIAGAITNIQTQQYFQSKNIHMFNVFDLPLDIEFDIVWAHHFPIIPHLIRRGLKYKRIINSSISEFLPIDKFMPFPKNIDLFLVLTTKSKNMFVKQYDFPQGRICILPNTAPDKFFAYKFTNTSNLSKIAIVSNHPPKELLDSVDIFKSNNIDVTIYGGKNSVDITPEILSQYDVIISIGKTVQYALAMGIPIYEYDHFGGSGYITPSNIDIEEASNFSGRSFYAKKNTKQIVDEILSQYKTVITYTNDLNYQPE